MPVRASLVLCYLKRIVTNHHPQLSKARIIWSTNSVTAMLWHAPTMSALEWVLTLFFSLLLSVANANWKQLFHTSGPYIGSEAPFPGPNDANKLRRSVASTHQQGRIFTAFDTFCLWDGTNCFTGLFAPRNRSGSGASPRDRNGNVTSPRVLRSRARTMSISQTAQASRTSPLVIRHASRRSLHSPPEDFSSPRKMGRDRRFSNGRK